MVQARLLTTSTWLRLLDATYSTISFLISSRENTALASGERRLWMTVLSDACAAWNPSRDALWRSFLSLRSRKLSTFLLTSPSSSCHAQNMWTISHNTQIWHPWHLIEKNLVKISVKIHLSIRVWRQISLSGCGGWYLYQSMETDISIRV